jgi:hypothetical protein
METVILLHSRIAQRVTVQKKARARSVSARMRSKRAVHAKLGMYCFASSLAAGLFGEMRGLTRRGERVAGALSHPPLPSAGSQQLPALRAHIVLSSGMNPPARLSGIELPWTCGAVETNP